MKKEPHGLDGSQTPDAEHIADRVPFIMVSCGVDEATATEMVLADMRRMRQQWEQTPLPWRQTA